MGLKAEMEYSSEGKKTYQAVIWLQVWQA